MKTPTTTKPKPSTSFEVERIPLAMCAARRWINWKPKTRDGTWTEVPCDASGAEIDATDPANWRTFAEARDAATEERGIGFVLGDGWLGVDLDGVVDPKSGAFTDPDAESWVSSTTTYVETSPSGTGVQAIFFGVELPTWSGNRRGHVEVYAEKRFFTVTGAAHYVDRDATPDQAAVDRLCEKHLRSDVPRPGGSKPKGSKKRSENPSDVDFSLACDEIRRGTPRPEVEADPTPPGAKTADRLVALALDRFELGRTPKGETFAVEKTGANVAIRLDGSAMKSTLSSLYFDEHASCAGSAAVDDALGVLRGQSMKTEPRELAIRYGRHGPAIVLDLGRVDGKTVVIDRDGWKVEPRSPILFERTELVGELPEPDRDVDVEGTLGELRGILNVGGDFDVLVGWIVAAMIPKIPHPILMLGGGQGTGKTTAATMIVGVFDASDAPTRSQPRDLENFCLSVAGSWSTVFDNVSKIPEWQSDALCMAATGGSFTKRALYTDRGLSVASFQRVLAITSIDAGSIRGDLAERLLVVDLDKIKKRRSETEIRAIFDGLRARLLGAFCTLVSSTLARLDTVRLDAESRMFDFARVLAALDGVRGTKSLDAYLGQGERLADDVVEGDSVGSAIRVFIEARTSWSGSMNDLLRDLRPDDPPPDFPRTPEKMSARMKRLIPALELVGIEVKQPEKNDKTRIWRMIARTAQPPESGPDGT